MPILEFYCPDNHKIYSFLARTLAEGRLVPRCPDDPAYRMEKRLSSFSITGQAKEDGGDDPFGDVDESKIGELMAEMDSGGFDEANPDPRKMARLMGKLREVMKGKVPGALDEMIARLEKGEEPEAIEREMGDAFEEADGDFASVKQLLGRARGPRRDPKLYEMREFT